MKRNGFWFLAAAMIGCGGSEPSPASPKAESDTTQPGKARGRATDEAAGSHASTQCDDGSCFACGDAICLVGFYCAVGKSGRGCAWLPSCATKASCACIAPTLREDPSCSCQEKEGGVYVTCDGARL